jgi:2-polyprenyl-3-methyl-5-hydroxy-6-metoxy-1,4-benzoquinol methylase
MNNHSHIKECPITGDSNPIKYFDLGNIPLVNNLCSTREESILAERFNLNINYYNESGLSSLDFAVDSELLFSHYLFKSGVNIPYYKHCKAMFTFIEDYINIDDNISIADIGGNDGTLLEAFRSQTDKNLDLVNIDPSKNLTKISIEKGIPVINNFFTYDLAKSIGKKFSIITSTNVFQHLKDINSFTKGIECMLEDDGVWILEFPYWIHDMKTNQFDQIYHEHMYYHSIKPMNLIMEKHGLHIINISKQNIHGGTLRLTICKKDSKHKEDFTVECFSKFEESYGLQYHIDWGIDIKEKIDSSKRFIKNLKESGKKIYGFGAAAKGCIYLNAMGLDYNDIDYIIDDTDIKQGKFFPGTGIQIVGRDILKDDKPDYILILAHNFSEYIISSLSDYDGEFIILVPTPTIIKNKRSLSGTLLQ